MTAAAEAVKEATKEATILDASIWLNEAIYRTSTAVDFAIDFYSDPPVDLSRYIISSFDSKLNFFRSYGITIVLVFDSARNPLKLDTIDDRMRKSKDALE